MRNAKNNVHHSLANSQLFYRFDPMEHVLDNPAWNALISGNKPLAQGNDRVKYFDASVSPFAAFNENTEEHFQLLYDMLPHDRQIFFIATVPANIPAQWEVLRWVPGLQMVFDGDLPEKATIGLTTLMAGHVPEMVALTKLTNPGPFAEKTIDFGHYKGVFQNDELVAMAGQRLHPFNYAEVSAVCTHPDHTGKGYARQLLLYQVARIKAAGEVPFLHARNSNLRAIKIYEDLGFAARAEAHFYFMRKRK
jgi:ribosomal protein S18 acetylase RimI-like enzyme